MDVMSEWGKVAENLFIYLLRMKGQGLEGRLATDCAGLALV